MKYLLPLVLLASAAWAAQRDPRASPARPSSEPAHSGSQQHVPWLADGDDSADSTDDADPHAGSYAEDDPHAGLYADDADPHAGLYADDADPHAGLYADDDSPPGVCPRDASDEGETAPAIEAEDPHVHARVVTAGVEVPQQGVARSVASNGHSISELYAQRSRLADHTIRVRGVVVKRTDGILGETYLHLRDGTGSTEQENDDLTVTTSEDISLGATVEVEGLLRVDQDLGLGYRYAALLTGARGIASK